MAEDLLKPSLQATGPAIAIYSARASFLVAFFGGPLAIVLFTGLNSRRLDRLRRDGLLLLIGAVVAIAILVAQIILIASVGEADSGWLTKQNMRIANRGAALLLCGAYYLMHRTQYRSMQFLGLESPDPYVAGIVCATLAFGITMALSAVIVAGGAQ